MSKSSIPARISSGVAVPTSAGALSLLLAAALALVSLRASNVWLLLVGCALFSPVLISQLVRPDLSSIDVGFGPTDRVAVGSSLEQVVHLHNRGRRSSPGFRLTHVHEGFRPTSLAVPGLPAGARTELPVRWTAIARTASDQHELELSSSAPFGLASYRTSLRVVAKINVHPAPGPIADLFEGARGEQAGGRPTRSGQELHGLREWYRGDALRQVHWRATARHDRLTVVIHEATLQSRVAIVVAGSVLDPRWEELLSTAAWTAVDVVTHGQGPVRLSAVGTAEYVGENADGILDWFAALGSVRPPTGAVLQAAADWADADGLLIVAGTSSPEPGDAGTGGRVMVLDPDGGLTS